MVVDLLFRLHPIRAHRVRRQMPGDLIAVACLYLARVIDHLVVQVLQAVDAVKDLTAPVQLLIDLDRADVQASYGEVHPTVHRLVKVQRLLSFALLFSSASALPFP